MDICNAHRYLFCIACIFYCSLCHSNSLNRVGAGVIPFPSNPSDTLIILDDLPDTDVYTLRTDEEYDLVFNFEISKYIGDRDKLLQHGLIEEEVKIAVATFDVDNGPESDSQLYFDCDEDGELDLIYYEVDEVYLNGEKIGKLTSGDEQ